MDAVWQCWIGPKHEWVEHAVLSAESYANRVGADYVFTDKPWVKGYHINFESLRAIHDRQFDKYDNLLVLDMDMLVHPEAINIFEIAGDDVSAPQGFLPPERQQAYELSGTDQWGCSSCVVYSKEARMKARKRWKSLKWFKQLRERYTGPGTVQEMLYVNTMWRKYHDLTLLDPAIEQRFDRNPKHFAHFTGPRKRFIPDWEW